MFYVWRVCGKYKRKEFAKNNRESDKIRTQGSWQHRTKKGIQGQKKNRASNLIAVPLRLQNMFCRSWVSG